MEGLYLYCLREKSESSQILSVKGIDGKEEVFIIPYQGLEAVVSKVSLEEFASEEIKRKAQEDLSWIKEKAVIHEKVVEEARKISSEFLKNTLNVKDVKVIKAGKVGDGWEAEAEVYEESSFIKSLGLPTRMQDRNIYGVKLNDNLEVQSYERRGQEK